MGSKMKRKQFRIQNVWRVLGKVWQKIANRRVEKKNNRESVSPTVRNVLDWFILFFLKKTRVSSKLD